MYQDVADAGIVFTAVGIVTANPASVESVLAWAAHLQTRVAYLWLKTASPSKQISITGEKATRRWNSEEFSSRL
jgi:hypothetical protein